VVYIWRVSEKYLKASEIAQRFNVKIETARKWVARGLFPNQKLEETVAGKIWLVPESDLEDFEPPQMGRPPKAKDKDDK